MATVYEYWQHRATGDIWAVKLIDGRIVAAVEMSPRNVDPVVLQHLPYRTEEARTMEKSRNDFRRIDGHQVA
jgi:hypothetical protein